MPYLVQGMVEQGVTFGLIGRRKEGKTYAALDLAFAVAGAPNHSKTWAMSPILENGPVRWIAAEGARSLAYRRIPQWRRHFGDCDVQICDERVNLKKDEHVEAILEACKGAKLIVIDSLRAATEGSQENSNDDIPFAVLNAQRIAFTTGAAVCLIAHAGKNRKEHSARGGSGIEDQLEAGYFVESKATPGFTLTKMFARDEATDDAPLEFQLRPISPEGVAPGMALDWSLGKKKSNTSSKYKKGSATELLRQIIWHRCMYSGVGKTSVKEVLDIYVDGHPDGKTKAKSVRDGARPRFNALAADGVINIKDGGNEITYIFEEVSQ